MGIRALEYWMSQVSDRLGVSGDFDASGREDTQGGSHPLKAEWEWGWGEGLSKGGPGGGIVLVLLIN